MDHRLLLVPASLSILVAIAIEYAWNRRSGRIPDLALMLGNGWVALFEQSMGLFVYAGLIGIYASLHALAPFSLDPSSPWTWVVAFLGVDLAFYAYHRFSHRFAFAWALHSVHHQSPELNFAAALRNSPLGGALQFAFHIPLALLGVPTLPWLIAKAINPLWQMVLHTEAVGRLPLVEGWLNTPAAHRVHHGLQRRCHDRNFGGILLIWDRVFGTWGGTERPESYGTAPALDSYDPIAAQLTPIVHLWGQVVEQGPRALLGRPRDGGSDAMLPETPDGTALMRGVALFALGVAVLIGTAGGVIPVPIGIPVLLAGGVATGWVLRSEPVPGALPPPPPAPSPEDADALRRLHREANSRPMRAWIPVVAALSEWIVIGGSIVLASRSPWWVWPFAIVVIAARQHGLLVLMHEAVHGQFHRRRWINDLLADVLCAWPLFITTATYRASHLRHHRELHTPGDPDWVMREGLSEWHFPMSPARLFGVVGSLGIGRGVTTFFRANRRMVTISEPLLQQGEWRVRSVVRWLVALGPLVMAVYAGFFAEVLLLWVVPILTVLPVLVRLRVIGEHYGMPADSVFSASRDWSGGALIDWMFVPWGIRMHRVHHLFPNVPFYRLEAVGEAMRADPTVGPACPRQGLGDLWRDLTTSRERAPR